MSPIRNVGFAMTVLLVVGLYSIYWADTAAKYSSYYVAVFVLPVVFGVLVGCMAAVVGSPEGVAMTARRIVKYAAAYGLVAVLLPAYVYLVLQFGAH